MIFRLVVSDTSDRTHCVQTPNLARCFVGVSVSTITSFSWFFMETDTESFAPRLMREIKSRSEDEHRFYLHHGHWPEQPCSGSDCLETSLPTERIKP